MSDELRARAAKAVRLIRDKGFRRMGPGTDDWIWVDYSLKEIEQALEDIAAFFVDRMKPVYVVSGDALDGLTARGPGRVYPEDVRATIIHEYDDIPDPRTLTPPPVVP